MPASKTAFAAWNQRLAPVFDTAPELVVVEAQEGRAAAARRVPLKEELPVQRALQLVSLGIGTLVCGAISRPLHDVLAAYGLRVVAFVAGDLDQVIAAWREGHLHVAALAMPGCRRRQGRGRSLDRGLMSGSARSGRNRSGTGHGHGGGRRAGRGQAGSHADPEAFGACLCPRCGHRQPHTPGFPCVESACPLCGAMMIRA